MKLTFLGGADEVGASSTLIEVAGKRLLVDVGIRISPKTVQGISGDQLPDLQQVSAAGGPDYILVTHAHTDHTGALPLVLEAYPHVPVYATEPTIALTKVLQADAQNIMKSKQEQEGELPLFDEIAVERLLNAFQTVQFRQPLRLGDGLQVTWHPSGHILGAAMLVIESEEGVLVMSGDLSLTPQRAVVKAQVPRVKADFLVLESTYGGRLHANRAAEEKRLIETLKRVVDRGGKAIIPAFALGRAQEVIQIIHAYRHELDVPVWVDGMVRSVCHAYASFADLLPQHSVKMAKNEHLFFRNNIKAVKSPAQREEIAHADGPAVIVSSSGMLTGGPSALYAKLLAEDERNAIFLTGYQDEESPGRFVQKMIKDREEGQSVTLKLDDTAVNLRCEIGMYSLSAHADETELLSIAEAVGADSIALVHGDGPARHSLASSLRARTKGVRLPTTGTSLELNFPKRPWAIGKVQSGSQVKALDTAALWESLKETVGSFYSARELAQAWWGDPERAPEVVSQLEGDGIYFAQSWRQKDSFQVRRPDQVERTQRQRAIMSANRDLSNKLLVLRDINGQVRVGVGKASMTESFTAAVLKAKGGHYPADALVWIVGTWTSQAEDKGFMAQLTEAVRQAEALRDTLMPFERRLALLKEAQAVLPAELLPATLPTGVSPLIAELSIVLALAKDGAIWVDGKLLPQQATTSDPMEMNLARQTVLALFPKNARLRKVGMDLARTQITLYFDFPSVAQETYADMIEAAALQTNWEIIVAPEVNQQALGTAAFELLPAGARISKGPSFFLNRNLVQVEVENLADPDAYSSDYQALTGFSLAVNSTNGQASQAPTLSAPAPSNNQMEINAAYKLIRNALEAHGLYKTSLKQDRIVLSFISPQVAARHHETLLQLAEQTGYELSVHPHPNQNAILLNAQQKLAQAGLNIKKGPSIFIERGEVAVTVTDTPADTTYLRNAFEHETGYKLIIN